MTDLNSHLDAASPAAQDYLKRIYEIEAEQSLDQDADDPAQISTKAISRRLGVSAASATNMLKKLDSMGLVEHVPYRGATLKPPGRKIALEVLRHHRLLETYLAEALGVPWDEVHDEAEILEHVLSERLEERISALLGHPTEDPHGHPIPTRSLEDPVATGDRLVDLAPGESGVVAQVSDRDPELLRYLGDMGLYPGVTVRTEKVEPFGGPVTILINGIVQVMGPEAATQVVVLRTGGER